MQMHQESLLPMIIISIIAALLSTMNVWSFDINHIRIHLNDIYMALLMTFWMIMLESGYNRTSNNVLLGIIGIILSLYLIRNQVMITDSQFLNGMIPHHSMAILMAQKIKTRTKDKRIIELADNIITNQTNEIEYMTKLGGQGVVR